MAGQLAVTARKSIPVENRSSRLFSAAGVGALVIATSQWAHWMGYADWDLLSLIPGFAQVTGLLPNAYADGASFDCPNKTLGSEIALMSDEMLKTVGKTLCTKEELIAASLRGGDGQVRRHQLALLSQTAEAVILPLMPIMHSPVQPPRFMQAPAVTPVAQSARPFTMASLAPVRAETNKDLIDEITLRARRVDSVDPCAGGLATRSAAGCGIDQVPVDDHHSGGGSSGGGSSGGGTGGGSDGGHDVTEIDSEDHSGSGGGSSGSDGGEGGEGDGGSHSGSDGHSGDGGHDGEDGHSGGRSGDGGSSHDSSGDYTDNSGSHGDGESHGGGDTSHDGGSDSSGHDSVETVDRSHDSGGEDSHSGSSTAEETHGGSSGGDYESRGGGSDSGSHGGSDGESSHGGGGGGGGGSGSDGGGHGSGRRG